MEGRCAPRQLSFSAGPAQCRRSIVRIYRHTLVGEGSGQARDAADCIGACVACVSTPLSTSRRALLQRACDAPKRSPVRRTRGTCMARPRIELRRPTRCLKNCLHPIIGLHTCRCQSISHGEVRCTRERRRRFVPALSNATQPDAPDGCISKCLAMHAPHSAACPTFAKLVHNAAVWSIGHFVHSLSTALELRADGGPSTTCCRSSCWLGVALVHTCVMVIGVYFATA